MIAIELSHLIFLLILLALIFFCMGMLKSQQTNYWQKKYKRLIKAAKEDAKFYQAKINSLEIDKDCLNLELSHANNTIETLSEEKANLLDSISYYKVAK